MLVLVSFWYGKGSNIQKKINAIKFYVFLTMRSGKFCIGTKNEMSFPFNISTYDAITLIYSRSYIGFQ